jgi:hypothetical protein
LEEWKSLYDPQLYRNVILEYNTENNGHEFSFKLNAHKDWKATILCNFDFSFFPFDTQTCEFIQFRAWESMNLTLLTHHKESWDHVAEGFNVAIIPKGTFLDDDDGETVLDKGVEFGFEIVLTRIVQDYLYKYYFPCFAIVVVSQISFIIPLSAIPGRVSLVVTQFLTLTNVFIYSLVNISYSTLKHYNNTN